MAFALQLALDSGFLQIQMESDCLTLIQAISDSCNDLSGLGLISDIIFLASFFNFASLSFVLRTANRVAHVLVNLVFFL